MIVSSNNLLQFNNYLTVSVKVDIQKTVLKIILNNINDAVKEIKKINVLVNWH